MLTREQMARRAAREISDGQRVYFGPGLPQAVQAVALKSNAEGAAGVYDIAFVEALEVDAHGVLTLAADAALPDAKRVVAVMPHALADGAPRIRAQLASSGPRAQLLITDRAVIDVTAHGLFLRELEAGRSAADVQAHTAAPLFADATLSLIAI